MNKIDKGGYVTVYTNGSYLQTYPVPDGPEWRVATEEDIETIKAPNRLLRVGLIEDEWREEQMPIAYNTVTAIGFGEEGIPGTIEQWKAYWLALRKWTVHNPDFPDSSKRPVAPM